MRHSSARQHKGPFANRKVRILTEAAMTGKELSLCDCPEPCGCYAEGYAAGKDKAFFEMEMALQDDTHSAGCAAGPARSSGPACGRR